MFPLQFANIFLTYHTSVANLHPLRVELRCKLQEKLPRVTGPIVIVEFEVTGGCSIAEKSDDVHRGSWIQGYRIGYVDLNVVRYSSENQRVDSYFVCQCSLVAIAKRSKNLYDMHLLCYLVCTQRARPCCDVHLLPCAFAELATVVKADPSSYILSEYRRKD